MSDNGDNFGGTTLTGDNGEQMDPAVAGISPPGIPTMQGDAAGAAIDADSDDEDAGEAEMNALSDQDDIASKSINAGIADETAAYNEAMTPTDGGDAADESEAQPS